MANRIQHPPQTGGYRTPGGIVGHHCVVGADAHSPQGPAEHVQRRQGVTTPGPPVRSDRCPDRRISHLAGARGHTQDGPWSGSARYHRTSQITVRGSESRPASASAAISAIRCPPGDSGAGSGGVGTGRLAIRPAGLGISRVGGGRSGVWGVSGLPFLLLPQAGSAIRRSIPGESRLWPRRQKMWSS